MYKDPEQQREAVRQATRRYRQRLKSVTDVTPEPENVTVTPSVTSIGCVTPPPPTFTVTPEGPKAEVPDNYGLEDCECKDCQLNRASGNKKILNHGKYKDCTQLADNEINRVSLPGDIDYSHHDTIEKCVECGGELPKLSRPRTRPGKCYPCVMGKQAVTA